MKILFRVQLICLLLQVAAGESYLESELLHDFSEVGEFVRCDHDSYFRSYFRWRIPEVILQSIFDYAIRVYAL